MGLMLFYYSLPPFPPPVSWQPAKPSGPGSAFCFAKAMKGASKDGPSTSTSTPTSASASNTPVHIYSPENKPTKTSSAPTTETIPDIHRLGQQLDAALTDMGRSRRERETTMTGPTVDLDEDPTGYAASISGSYGRDVSGDLFRSVPTPPHTLTEKPAKDGSGRVLELSVVMEGVASASEVDVVYLDKEVRVLVPGRYRLVLALPRAVSVERVAARFVKKAAKLALTMPITGT